ncbi:hypothetical protein QYE76_023519 [Lolium multiflorum]|uniref:BHLH domain-containing protein n=1 Tax=Lolium multiflorum TaxID=4521 RepID=A0AAD8VSC0_LOLMU|nr:hypothetical protein QYE76_023519 [Lolium multiflorum]
MRRFMPAGGGGGEPTSSSSSGQHGDHPGNEAAAAAGGLRYGGGDISLGRGGHDLHRAQFRGEAEMKDQGADMLSRHSSSPAGFFSNLMVDDGSGFHGARAGGGGAEAHRSATGSAKMKSQLRFAAGGPPQGTANLSRISEGAALFPGADAIRAGGEHAVSRSFSTGGSTTGGFSIVGPWDESRDIIGTLDLSGYESQFSGLGSSSSLELAGMDKYMQAAQQQQDGVAFKVRAKRGCATHPRSIAERERRTRISDKLRKLQDLVPNMDKQTSTSDMLDLAVEHIKGLQSQLQAMKHEQEKCTCCSKP